MAAIRRKLKEKLLYVTSSAHKEITPGSRKQHDNVVRDMTIQLEEYFNPFLEAPARHFKSGVEIDKDIINGLLSSQEIGEASLKTFIEERVKATDDIKISIFEPIKRQKLATGLKKEKKTQKSIDILKEDRQAFGLLVGKVKTPEEALAHPLTTIPLALANPDNTLRQGSKATLRNFLIEESNAICDAPNDEADWFIDGMAAAIAVKAGETWEAYANNFLKFCMPKVTKVKRLFIIFDSYRENSIKQMTQLGRGKPGRNVYITNMKQKKPKNSDWYSFLRNSHNKTELICALVRHFKSDDVRMNFQYPIIVTAEEKTWQLSTNQVLELPSSNHVEADTRIIMEALKSENTETLEDITACTIIVKAADTDILVLMCYAHSHKARRNQWIMQIDSERFVNINAIEDHFGEKICNLLPAYHSITGCDTTSYPATVGKVKPLKKLIKQGKEYLLEEFGSNLDSESNLQQASEFFQTVLYSGKNDETITQTRCRMYTKQKIKSSANLIPDVSSAMQGTN